MSEIELDRIPIRQINANNITLLHQLRVDLDTLIQELRAIVYSSASDGEALAASTGVQMLISGRMFLGKVLGKITDGPSPYPSSGDPAPRTDTALEMESDGMSAARRMRVEVYHTLRERTSDLLNRIQVHYILIPAAPPNYGPFGTVMDPEIMYIREAFIALTAARCWLGEAMTAYHEDANRERNVPMEG